MIKARYIVFEWAALKTKDKKSGNADADYTNQSWMRKLQRMHISLQTASQELAKKIARNMGR